MASAAGQGTKRVVNTRMPVYEDRVPERKHWQVVKVHG
jgi:hypothetical protein